MIDVWNGQTMGYKYNCVQKYRQRLKLPR